jgi:hypothetical protein
MPPSNLEPAPGHPGLAAHQVLTAERVAVERHRRPDRAHRYRDVVEDELRHAAELYSGLGRRHIRHSGGPSKGSRSSSVTSNPWRR